MKNILLTIAALLLLAAPALAQDAPTRTPGILYAAIIAGQALDLGTTEYALSTGRGQEANPIMAKRSVRIGAKSAFTVGAMLATRSLWKSGRHTQAVWLAVSLGAAFSVVGAHNLAVVRR